MAKVAIQQLYAQYTIRETLSEKNKKELQMILQKEIEATSVDAYKVCSYFSKRKSSISELLDFAEVEIPEEKQVEFVIRLFQLRSTRITHIFEVLQRYQDSIDDVLRANLLRGLLRSRGETDSLADIQQCLLQIEDVRTLQSEFDTIFSRLAKNPNSKVFEWVVLESPLHELAMEPRNLSHILTLSLMNMSHEVIQNCREYFPEVLDSAGSACIYNFLAKRLEDNSRLHSDQVQLLQFLMEYRFEVIPSAYSAFFQSSLTYLSKLQQSLVDIDDDAVYIQAMRSSAVQRAVSLQLPITQESIENLLGTRSAPQRSRI